MALTVVTSQYQQDVARAQAVSDRITAITGCQCGLDECLHRHEVTCWRCHAVISVRDAWSEGADYACTNEQACNERAAADAESEDAEFIYAARGRGDNGGI